jgi:hypothetical protein
VVAWSAVNSTGPASEPGGSAALFSYRPGIIWRAELVKRFGQNPAQQIQNVQHRPHFAGDTSITNRHA